MARKAGTFLRVSVATHPFTVRISATVKEQLQLLEQRIAKEAPQMAFDRAQVIEAALQQAIEAANAELDRMQQRPTQPARAS